MNEDGGESTEPEHADKTLFFGGQTNEQPGNYTVNAIDVEELRRSQRRPRPNDLATNPSQVCTGKNSRTLISFLKYLFISFNFLTPQHF